MTAETCPRCSARPLAKLAEVAADACEHCQRIDLSTAIAEFVEAHARPDLRDLGVEELWNLRNFLAELVRRLDVASEAVDAVVREDRLRGDGAFRLGDDVLRATPQKSKRVCTDASGLFSWLGADVVRVFNPNQPRFGELVKIAEERDEDDPTKRFFRFDARPGKVEVVPTSEVKWLSNLPEGEVVLAPRFADWRKPREAS